MTTKELTQVITKHNLTLSEINQALVQLTRMNINLHESIKSLERTAVAHESRIAANEKLVRSLARQWQAYLNTRPKV